jgi:hypothetical protein
MSPWFAPASNIFLSEQISHQQPAGSTFLSQQIITSHQPNEQAGHLARALTRILIFGM